MILNNCIAELTHANSTLTIPQNNANGYASCRWASLATSKLYWLHVNTIPNYLLTSIYQLLHMLIIALLGDPLPLRPIYMLLLPQVPAWND